MKGLQGRRAASVQEGWVENPVVGQGVLLLNSGCGRGLVDALPREPLRKLTHYPKMLWLSVVDGIRTFFLVPSPEMLAVVSSMQASYQPCP